MKKLILSLMLTTFAAAAAYAGDCQGSSCCSKANETTKTKAGTCPNASKVTTKSTKKNATAKQTLQSPKAMSLASR
ncbi:MAG TPA: hypothetical protein VL361_02615 [Candidatus Limnocylindrales bacterium]|nr:hypothetical protein [Candidatus Limnocylindrales bacterium]